MTTTSLGSTSKKLLWLAIACILIVNAVILGKVFFNRAETIMTLTLSERELLTPNRYGFKNEDSSMRVSLRWKTLSPELLATDANIWSWRFDRRLVIGSERFTSFHFPACSQDNFVRDKKSAWVLLEFNGASYADYVAKAEAYFNAVQKRKPTADSELTLKEWKAKQEDAETLLRDAKDTDTRLFVIDAAPERSTLEAALQSVSGNAQRVIVPAEVSAYYHYPCKNPENRTPTITISNLAVESLYVPKAFAKNLKVNSAGKAISSFNADIHYGRLHEPWIAKLISCQKDCQ